MGLWVVYSPKALGVVHSLCMKRCTNVPVLQAQAVSDSNALTVVPIHTCSPTMGTLTFSRGRVVCWYFSGCGCISEIYQHLHWPT